MLSRVGGLWVAVGDWGWGLVGRDGKGNGHLWYVYDYPPYKKGLRWTCARLLLSEPRDMDQKACMEW